jgi:hypothetical protein
MKLEVRAFSAIPMDTYELRPLPPGEVEVSLRVVCDKEAFDRIKELIRTMQAGRAAPAADEPALEQIEPKRLGQ